MELLIAKRLLIQKIPEELEISGAPKDSTSNLVNVIIQTAERNFLSDIRPAGKLVTFPWNLTVVDFPQVNAYCAPAGQIVVYSGLIDFCVEAEKQGKLESAAAAICGVLAHEISHGVCRHGMETLSWMPLLLIIMVIAQGFFFSLGFSMEDVKLLNSVFEDTVQFFLQLPHSRKVESEADLMGAEILEKSGLPFGDYPRILGLLQSGGAEWLSSHPSPEKRAHDIERFYLRAEARETSPLLREYLREADTVFSEFYNRPSRVEPGAAKVLRA